MTARDASSVPGESVDLEAFAPKHDDFLTYPRLQTLAVVRDAAHAQAAVRALVDAGFDDESDITIAHGHAGADWLDLQGRRHARRHKIWRTIQMWVTSHRSLPVYERALRNGCYVFVVRTSDEDAFRRARKTLETHGGERIRHYTRMLVHDPTEYEAAHA